MNDSKSLLELNAEELLQHIEALRKRREDAALNRLIEKATKIKEVSEAKENNKKTSARGVQSLIDSIEDEEDG